MSDMKRLFLIFTMAMFLANSFVVAVWAKPCINSSEVSVSMEISSSGNMPCHERSQQDTHKHCDGLCLCLHVLTSQTPLISNEEIKDIPNATPVEWAFFNEDVTSLQSSPPHRPPNKTS